MMRPRRALAAAAAVVLVILAAFLSACAGTGTSGDVPLKYQYKAGDSFTYDLTLAIDGGVEGPGIPAEEGAIPGDMNLELRVTMAVKEVTDGVATVGYTYESLAITSGGEKVPVPAGSLPDMTVKVDEQGRILSIEGLDKLLPPGLSLSSLPFDPSQLSGQTNVIYPEGGLAKPGDTWEATSRYPIPGAANGVESKVTGKLLSVAEEDGRDLATIEFSVNTPMDFTIDLGAMMQEMGLDKLMAAGQQPENLAFELTVKGAQDMQGTSRIDTENGMPVSLDGDVTLKMSMEVIDAPAAVVPEDQRGPISMDMRAKLSLNQVK